MALSGSNTGAQSSGFSLRIDWSATQNKAANTSTVTATAYLVIASGWYLDINSRTGVITIDGTNYTISYHLGSKGAGAHKLGAASKTITHNTDGTKSFVISGSAKIDASITGYGWVGTLSKGNDTYTLDAIPRYAAITAFSASINDRTASLSWTADRTISHWRYSSNSGSSYSGWIALAANVKSGSTSISVSPGSTYGFRIQVRNAASSLDTTSSTLSRTATKTPTTLSFNTTSQNVGSTDGIRWTVNRSYSEYRHKITYAFGNTSGYIVGNATSVSNTLSGTWVLPTALANQIPNATSGTGTIYIYTYYNSVHVGTNSYTFTAKVADDTTRQPSVPSITVSHVGSRPSGATSYVQGRSQVQVRSSSTAQGGASISSYRVTVSGIGTYYGSNITSDYLTNAETVTITVRATDSRGYHRENSTTIKVDAYSPPTLTTYSAARGPDDERDLVASINFSISPIGDKNTKQYRIRYRSTDEAGWTSLFNSTAYYTRNTTHTARGVLNQNKSYEIEFYIKDYYESVTRTLTVGTAFTLMDFHETGRAMAIGKVSEGNGFEVGMPTTIFNTEPDILKLKRSSPFANVNLVFENESQTRYLSFKDKGGPRWNTHNNVNHPDGFDFWTEENSDVITESGSNSNGRYIKFTDGTMICYRESITLTVVWSQAVSANWTFPASFNSTSVTVLPSFDLVTDPRRGKLTLFTRDTTRTKVEVLVAADEAVFTTGDTQNCKLMAIGRWK